MNNLWIVIMAGGKGERFWPMSTASMPKHLLAFVSKKSMIQQTVERSLHLAHKDNILIITNKSQYPKMKKHLHAIKNIIAEPMGKNTAAAIGLAAVLIRRVDPDAAMVVLPSDHMIQPHDKFADILRQASESARKSDALITLGIKPRFAFTGYGYIKIGKKVKTRSTIAQSYKLNRFVEKPDEKTAQKYLKSGKYLWNSGIFIWKAQTILDEIKRHMPGLYRGLDRIDRHVGKNNFEKVLAAEYKKLKDISIDYGVMERTKKALVISADLQWDDIGSWSAMSKYGKIDGKQNSVFGEHKGLDTKDCTIMGQSGHLIATIGTQGLIIVHSKNATLVCAKDKSQRVKELVHQLKADKRFEKYTK